MTRVIWLVLFWPFSVDPKLRMRMWSTAGAEEDNAGSGVRIGCWICNTGLTIDIIIRKYLYDSAASRPLY